MAAAFAEVVDKARAELRAGERDKAVARMRKAFLDACDVARKLVLTVE